MVPVMKSHKTNSLEPTTIESHSHTAQGLTHTPTISHEDEKTALIYFSLVALLFGFCFDESLIISPV